MRAVRLAAAGAALAAAGAAVLSGVFRVLWPGLSGWLGVTAVVLAVAAWQTAVGRHRGRTGAHARPPVLVEARAAAAERAGQRAETSAVRAAIDPARPAPPPAPQAVPAVPARAGRLPAVAVPALLGRTLVPPDWAGPDWAAPAGAHHRPVTPRAETDGAASLDDDIARMEGEGMRYAEGRE